MTAFIWPITVAIISTVFFLIFKRPLSQFLDRTVSVGPAGVETSDGKPSKQLADGEEYHAALEAKIRAAYKEETSEINSKLFEAQNSIAEIKAELLRFQKNIGYKRGELV